LRPVLPGAVLSLTVLLSACSGSDDPASEGPEPSATAESIVLTLGGGTGAKCIMPNPDTLSGFADAFSGTVTEVHGNEAVLLVDHWYVGGEADRVVVRTSDGAITEAGLRDLREGQRYLISGDQGTVSLCGFSDRWSPRLERMYDEAFGS